MLASQIGGAALTTRRAQDTALEALTPEERHHLYKMLRLRVTVQPDGTTQVSGAFTEGQGVSTLETISRCCGHRHGAVGQPPARRQTGALAT